MVQTALITGASSGIGMDLAKLFAADGYNLVVVARSEQILVNLAEDLTKKSQIKIDIITADLSEKDAAKKLFEELKNRNIELDVLVNSAGLGDMSSFAEESDIAISAMVDVNIKALTELTRYLLPDMLKKGHGKILNVASTAAFQPGPYMAVYYASKAYVLSFSEAIRYELKEKGVQVTTLCPGPTKTGFLQKAHMTKSGLATGRIGMQDSAEVAKLAYTGLQQGKSVIITGIINKIIAFFTPFTPRWLTLRIVSALHQK